jgi:hypothetical protein
LNKKNTGGIMNDSVRTEHIPGLGKKVLYILGWGEKLEDNSVRFLINSKPIDWDLVVVEIPTEFTDFDNVITDIKVKCWHNTDILIGFSIGAIFARHKEASKRIFISPYWKIPKIHVFAGFRELAEKTVKFFNEFPILNYLPIVPRDFANCDIGDIDIPKHVPTSLSPKTAWQIIKAQKQMPDTNPNDVVLYSEQDIVIDSSACLVGNHRIETFTGKHHPFCGKNREKVFKRIVELT